MISRKFAITRRDLLNYGCTQACPGCYAAVNDRNHNPHTPACRDRILRALAEDETQSHRATDARERENAFLEHAIRVADDEGINKSDAQRRNPPDVPMANIQVPTPVTPMAKDPLPNKKIEEAMTYEDTLIKTMSMR